MCVAICGGSIHCREVSFRLGPTPLFPLAASDDAWRIMIDPFLRRLDCSLSSTDWVGSDARRNPSQPPGPYILSLSRSVDAGANRLMRNFWPLSWIGNGCATAWKSPEVVERFFEVNFRE